MIGLTVLLGAGVVACAAELGLASYFFRRTMLRQNAKTERTIRMSGTNWDQYRPKLLLLQELMLARPHEDVWIQAEDGLKLHGTYFPGKGNKIILAFHGYTSMGMSDYIGLSGYYLSRGYGMLLVDERAHGESEGTYIGFGCLDRMDALKWISYLQAQLGKDCSIWLHGISMGASTVLMASGLQLPACVKGIIADCGFTSAWEVFTHVLKTQYHLPAFPILHLSDQIVKSKAGYSLRSCNAREEVKRAQVPILLIHGEQDTFVPCAMCHQIYEACASEKDMLIIKGAGHCEAFYKDQAQYEGKLTSFLEKERTVHEERH